ncbi:hypothetical protein BVZ63_1206 [Haemophilus influenzae]|nr:hypothetical protein BV131_1206 [Haemophilus influenzae]AVJ05236.1 hypothetical protein BV134_1207 [Haemophilus influenzae]AVJ10645.1 hypothetical protein BVZ63_1206 [Haemophilus influenzae]
MNGLPGARRIKKKEKVIKINSVGKASNSRLKINLSITTPTKMGEKCGQKIRRFLTALKYEQRINV